MSVLAALPLLAALALVACGSADGGDDGAGVSPTRAAAPAATPTAASAALPPAPAGQVGSVTMADFSYTPSRLNARAGQQVQLSVVNRGQAPHTFTIAGFVDSGIIAAGETRTVTFTPTTAGTLTFFCTVHGAAVMSGEVTVEATASSQTPDGFPTDGEPVAGAGAYDYASLNAAGPGSSPLVD